MRYNYPRFRARLKDTNEFVFWNDYGEITKPNGTPDRFPISREPGATNYYYYIHIKM